MMTVLRHFLLPVQILRRECISANLKEPNWPQKPEFFQGKRKKKLPFIYLNFRHTFNWDGLEKQYKLNNGKRRNYILNKFIAQNALF